MEDVLANVQLISCSNSDLVLTKFVTKFTIFNVLKAEFRSGRNETPSLASSSLPLSTLQLYDIGAKLLCAVFPSCEINSAILKNTENLT